jgi:flagellin
MGTDSGDCASDSGFPVGIASTASTLGQGGLSRQFKEGEMIINHNMSALYANRVLKFQNMKVNKNIEKLSSGLRINRAGDDASGLAVSEKLRSQIRGLNQAERNIENAVSFIQATEGYLGESHEILHRLRELAVQSANGIYSDEDRMQIQVEVSQLVDEINRIASHAQFNGMNTLTGAFADPARGGLEIRSMYFQVGANMDQRERVFIGTMTAQALGLQSSEAGQSISISTPDQANRAIGLVDAALTVVSKQRADLGAYQNRFEIAAKGVAVAAENMQAAESLIRDTDMAAETVKFVKNQIMAQVGTAMLAQANLQGQNVLQLLQ